jgi:pimeloyl-ACP methyl ester carboxylesterase
MNSSAKVRPLLQPMLMAAATILCVFGTAKTTTAQSIEDLQTPKSPLVLKARGSFFVGGEAVMETPTELSTIFGTKLDNGGGHIVINQMYVQYMIPVNSRGVPVVMLHGATLSAKTYETTPDGRMGWDEYFVRRGHAVYLPDQVSRARSGVDIARYNDVRAGVLPPNALPNAFRQSNEINWTTFRFGPAFGTPFPDEQFPVHAADAVATQAIPDFNAALPTPNPTYKALSDLAAQLKGAIVMGHSESGAFPLQAALTNKAGMKGLVLLEPGRCGYPDLTDQQIATLVSVPILVVFGDHLDVPTGMAGFSWKDAFDHCTAFVARVNAAHGNAQMLHPPELGIHGNSHMIMQDKNNLQIADLILKWIDQNTSAKEMAH